MSTDDSSGTHRTDPFFARQVEAMAGYGLPAESIALVLGIDRKTLERDYGEELKGGAVKANAKVAESLFRKATGDGPQSVPAAIFWLKTRAGWKETSVHEHGGADGPPLTVVVRRFSLPSDDEDVLPSDAPLIEARPVSPGDDDD